MQIRELDIWEPGAALLIDGGAGPPQRPAVHLQAAEGGYLRLLGPDGPVMWGLVDEGYWGVSIVRAKGAPLHVLPPIRVADAEQAPGSQTSTKRLAWWTRHFATQLCESASSPLAGGRHCILAPTQLVGPNLVLRRDRLDELVDQRDEFELKWDIGYLGLLLMRPLSNADDGRVKMWRKRAREGQLPSLLTWWCEGLYAHVLLDGHDRVHAALLEGCVPSVIVLTNATAASSTALGERKQLAQDHASLLARIGSVEHRASVMNTLLRQAWDPREEWKQATPGFPLDGGVAQWEEEVRGTWLEGRRES